MAVENPESLRREAFFNEIFRQFLLMENNWLFLFELENVKNKKSGLPLFLFTKLDYDFIALPFQYAGGVILRISITVGATSRIEIGPMLLPFLNPFPIINKGIIVS